MNKTESKQIPFKIPSSTNSDLKQLCLDLLQADTEESVMRILKGQGYWDNTAAWRYYGDKEGNYSTIGNQTESSEAALVEKVVNSIDAVLMNECWIRGMNPNEPKAPKSIKEAVSEYFGDGIERMGSVTNWTSQKRREVSRRITIAATGSRSGNPCFTIADNGEGQTPKTIVDTLLSLDKRNKVSIHFVQGTFNMGGTGVLKFCGIHNLQLIITKRNPIIKDDDSDSDRDKWAFTIVRRENPPPGEKNSIYTYLAPIHSKDNPQQGEVLFFQSDSLPLFPTANKPYNSHTEWGTLVKLYEYQATGFRSNILRSDGLLSRLDILLPEIALPVRLHECRGYGGETERSFETTLTGLSVRLGDDRAGNLEDGFPDTGKFMVDGQQMTYTVYAFKPDKGKTYKKRSEGIIFTINGQTHATISSDYFTRGSVKKGRLKDSILVIIDCSGIDGRIREDLFPNSRDRISRNDFRNAIENQLNSLLLHHQGLRALSEKRMHEEFEAAISDDKPLAEALSQILKSSPTLSSLFITGNRLPNPFKTMQVGSGDKGYEGKRHPSFFKFEKLDYGKHLFHKTPKNMRCRIIFETNVDNDYFARVDNRGEFILKSVKNEQIIAHTSYVLTLRDGRAVLTLTLPDDCIIGQEFEYEVVVTDPTLVDSFDNNFTITVMQEQNIKPSVGKRANPPSNSKGDNREKESGLAIPKIIEISEPQWGTHDFNKYSALKITQEDVQGTEDNSDANSNLYTFYVNVDNVFLQTEVKTVKVPSELLKKRFVYGMALIGMALIRDRLSTNTTPPKNDSDDGSDQNESQTIEDLVWQTSVAIAPALLPMIEKLGRLAEEDVQEEELVSSINQ